MIRYIIRVSGNFLKFCFSPGTPRNLLEFYKGLQRLGTISCHVVLQLKREHKRPSLPSKLRWVNRITTTWEISMVTIGCKFLSFKGKDCNGWLKHVCWKSLEMHKPDFVNAVIILLQSQFFWCLTHLWPDVETLCYSSDLRSDARTSLGNLDGKLRQRRRLLSLLVLSGTRLRPHHTRWHLCTR